jgi:hypothetical protein
MKGTMIARFAVTSPDGIASESLRKQRPSAPDKGRANLDRVDKNYYSIETGNL